MASASSIMKLHRNQATQLRVLVAQPAPFKTAILADSQPDLLALQTAAWQQPARRRFGSSGRFSAPALMGTTAPTGIPTGRSSFADVGMRETVQAMRATLTRRYSQQAQRGAAGHQQWPMAIQL